MAPSPYHFAIATFQGVLRHENVPTMFTKSRPKKSPRWRKKTATKLDLRKNWKQILTMNLNKAQQKKVEKFLIQVKSQEGEKIEEI